MVNLAHNHPSGDPEPRDADWRITERLKEYMG
ncbi:JAB domain-containing protein [Halomonas sp. AOP43-A1-21]